MAVERIGRYRILQEIAAGAQGTVYRGFDPEGGRLVAVKVLHPTLTGDATYVERFHREASLAASIDHPNVIRIFEVGEDAGRHFMALEFLPESLSRLIESGGLPPERAAAVAAEIGDGLGAAHARGIVHRDMKPQNVLVTPEGTPKVTDFGIARAESMSTMTATGMMMGTPYYMSPEQARGERADARSDVYSLGCVVYQMLTGQVPFDAPTPLAVLRHHTDSQPRPVRELRSDVPRSLADVVRRSMERDPARRYANASEMAEAVRSAMPGLAPAAAVISIPSIPVIPRPPPPPPPPP
ncbi:MAG: serine/threonine protein kinase, partial [Gemmatimonadetes bacterium]|nr:serine/threonine protein kinase [Gemmatimonadota bacterium]